MDEENPTYAVLLKKMVLAQHNYASCYGWKRLNNAMHVQKRV